MIPIRDRERLPIKNGEYSLSKTTFGSCSCCTHHLWTHALIHSPRIFFRFEYFRYLKTNSDVFFIFRRCFLVITWPVLARTGEKRFHFSVRLVRAWYWVRVMVWFGVWVGVRVWVRVWIWNQGKRAFKVISRDCSLASDLVKATYI